MYIFIYAYSTLYNNIHGPISPEHDRFPKPNEAAIREGAYTRRSRARDEICTSHLCTPIMGME